MIRFKPIISESIEESSYLKVLDSIDVWGEVRSALENIISGDDCFLYHGTNRDFDKFDISKVRDWRANKFYGDGIFLTPDKDVAYKYANANANEELPISILDDAKKVDRRLYDFMYSLYYKGNSTWQMEKFKWIHDDWKFKVDPNDVADIVNHIPGSQSEKDYNDDRGVEGGNEFVNFFDTSSHALSEYTINDIKEIGLGDYTPKIYIVKMKGSDSVLMSKNKSAIRNSKSDITIAYGVPDLINNVPEVIVKTPSLLTIVKKQILD